MSAQKILLTGATGFLGSSLLHTLIKQGYKVAVLKRKSSDLTRIQDVEKQTELFNADEGSLEDHISASKPDMIIHCATDYGRKNATPSLITETNLLFPLKLLELCGKYKISTFINTDTALDKNTNHYSLSKKHFKEWLEVYSSSMICANMELEHFYGPGDDKSKFVSFLIDTFLSDKPEINLTAGEQKRDFTYIDDVVNAYLLVIEKLKNKDAGFYNYSVASNETIKIKELVANVQKLSGNTATKVNLGAVPYRKNELMESHIDTEAIRNLGWKPSYTLMSGLTKTIQDEKKLKQN